MRHLNRIGKRGGFTLVEALVAFAILALVMSGLLAGISGAARSDDRADFMQRTTRLAQSKLDELGVTTALVVGVSSGRWEDGSAWRLDVEPYEVAAASGAKRSVVSAYWIYLTVERNAGMSGGSQIVTLTTVRLVAPHRPARSVNPDTL